MGELNTVLPALFSELVNGNPDPSVGTFMLNRGDLGLLHALDQLSAASASRTAAGGATIAAHTDHLRYGLELLNRWASGEPSPWKTADWTASWRKQVVTDDEWRKLRRDLRREAEIARVERAIHRHEIRPRAFVVGHLEDLGGRSELLRRSGEERAPLDERQQERELLRVGR